MKNDNIDDFLERLIFETSTRKVSVHSYDPTAPIWNKDIWFKMSRWGKESGKFSDYKKIACFKFGLYLSKGYELSERQLAFAHDL
jgi:hypothetical protein